MNKSIKLIIIFLSINSIVFGQNTMTLEEVINSYFERTNAAKINTIGKNILFILVLLTTGLRYM